MKPFFQDAATTLFRGDALGILRNLQDDSVDAVLTDPPYSSGGMTLSARQADPRVKYQHTRTVKTYPPMLGGQQGSAGVYVLGYVMAHGMLEDGAGGKPAVVVYGLEAVARNDRRCAVGGLAVAWHCRLAHGQREADGRGVPQGQRVCDLRL